MGSHNVYRRLCRHSLLELALHSVCVRHQAGSLADPQYVCCFICKPYKLWIWMQIMLCSTGSWARHVTFIICHISALAVDTACLRPGAPSVAAFCKMQIWSCCLPALALLLFPGVPFPKGARGRGPAEPAAADFTGHDGSHLLTPGLVSGSGTSATSHLPCLTQE